MHPSLVGVLFAYVQMYFFLPDLLFGRISKRNIEVLTGMPRKSDFCSLMFFDVCFSLFSQLITA